MNARVSRIAIGAFLALAAIFAAASLYAILQQAIYVPYQDQWGWIDRYLARDETMASLLVTPINGHLVVLPGLVFWADAALTGASNRLNLAAMLACIAGICVLLRTRFPGLADSFSTPVANAYFGVVVVLMLWFHHWENLFWPFQLHLYLSILFSMAALSVLSAASADGAGLKVLLAAAALGILAGASFGPGLGVWASFVVVIALGRRSVRWKSGAIALAFGIAALFAWYLSIWVVNESHPVGLLSSLNQLALYLGSPFFHGYNERVLITDLARLTVPLIAGYAGLLLALWLAIRLLRLRRRRPLSSAELFFAGMTTFGLVAGAMVALVRGGGTAPMPTLASRYGVLCLLFWLSAVPLATAGLSATRIRLATTVVPIALLALLVYSQVRYLGWWLNWRSMIEAASAATVSRVPDPDFLAYVLYRPDMVERVSGDLMRRKLSPLYEERTRWIGRPLSEVVPPIPPCRALVDAAVAVPGGYRIGGAVDSEGLPFEERPVFVTDPRGTVVGLGNVDRGWYGRWRDFGARRARTWRAFAPLDQASLSGARIFISNGAGICEVKGGESLSASRGGQRQ